MQATRVAGAPLAPERTHDVVVDSMLDQAFEYVEGAVEAPMNQTVWNAVEGAIGPFV